MPLAPAHEALQAEVRAFVAQHVAPRADEMHRTQHTPPALIAQLAERGYLGAAVPTAFGGRALDAIGLGILAGELAAGCSSLRSLLTVHSMVAHTIARWGSRAQKETWLPRLASGSCIAAFALTEPGAGSDANAIATKIARHGSDLVIDGEKVWITYGQIAQLYLLFGVTDDGPTAVLVERGPETAGFTTAPILDLFGIRASMTARLRLTGCRVPGDRIIGRPGLGIAQIAASALDGGRYTVAWGAVGILRACLEASSTYAMRRRQFGVAIKDHQLVRQKITAMHTDWNAARLLCLEAGALREAGDPAALGATAIAKYFASTAAVRAATDAMQLHGANGCAGDYPLQRYLGDAKVLEIIEGSTQLQEVAIADYAYQEHGHARPHQATAAWRES